jgi:hypothetical protein
MLSFFEIPEGVLKRMDLLEIKFCVKEKMVLISII